MLIAHCQPQDEFPRGLKGIIFDLDGVIIDSRAANTAFYNKIRSSIGMPNLTKEEENFVHMATVTDALVYIIPESMRYSAETTAAFMRVDSEIPPTMAVERYLPEFLSWLKECNYDLRLAICTNRIDHIDNILTEFKLTNYFNPIKTAAMVKPKPAPEGLMAILAEWQLDPCQVAYIGDSKVDELAAISSGIPFWAFKNEELDARLHINSFQELWSWLPPLLRSKKP